MTATTTAVPVPAYPDPSLLYPGYAAHMTATTTAVPVPAYPDPSTVDPMGDPMSQE